MAGRRRRAWLCIRSRTGRRSIAGRARQLFRCRLAHPELTFNKADNFNPPPAFYTDYFGQALGKPQGKEKDYGLEIATPDKKFFLRATWFNTTNENAIVTLTSTGRANYIDQTELKNWATKVVQYRIT